MSDPETAEAKVLRVAMAMCGPHSAVIDSSPHTLEELRHVRWGFLNRSEQRLMLSYARWAIAEIEGKSHGPQQVL